LGREGWRDSEGRGSGEAGAAFSVRLD
jgi:hypothetical protein